MSFLREDWQSSPPGCLAQSRAIVDVVLQPFGDGCSRALGIDAEGLQRLRRTELVGQCPELHGRDEVFETGRFLLAVDAAEHLDVDVAVLLAALLQGCHDSGE